MSCHSYIAICILMCCILRIQSRAANSKGSDDLPNITTDPLISDEKNDDLPNITTDPLISDKNNEIEKEDIKRTSFMVSIQRNEYRKFTHLCGGAIISEYFVITTAHCTLKPRQLYAKDISVLAGSPRLFVKNARRFQVKKMKQHPLFVPLEGNDILLLQVEKIPIDNIRFGTIDYRVLSSKGGGLNVHLLGWGRTKGNQAKDLEVLPVKTIENFECFRDYRFKYLTNSEICARGLKGTRGACDVNNVIIMLQANK
ncbi:hypothetical protein KR093_011318 [Drosophila rubida]|uniref:Peptidase S1 domain-containing protein n=1 Tax=Drosophila rubida TaxID=30044 RepID=A0AAD4JWW6_9MUSC|nr:hypothetical protein KR093_011318 [Drosophila rubida]